MQQELRPTICPYCGVGCGLLVAVRGGEYAGVEYWLDHPVNRGALCAKGNDLSFLVHPQRLRRPLIRSGGSTRQVQWSEALSRIASELKRLARDDPHAIGVLVSAKLLNEEAYAWQKLARVLGSPNVDHCARLCHAATVAAMRRLAGVGAMIGSYEDLLESRVVVIWGLNLAVSHPILMGRYVLEARRRGAHVIVVDPRRTETADKADLHLQLRPGTDVHLALAIANVLIEEGLVDPAARSLEGYEELASAAEEWTPERAAEATGVAAERIREAALAIGSASEGSLLWGMGLTQHPYGTTAVEAVASIAVLRGWLGRRGCLVGGVRGHSNVQGACDMGCLAEYLPGYREASIEEHVEELARLWSTEELPRGPGLTSSEMIEAAARGKLRALIVVGENPVVAEPGGPERVAKALSNLELLVAVDILPSETVRLADVVLPAAAQPEKEGSVTSADRRVQWSHKALNPPGEAKPDLEIATQLAKHLGLEKHLPWSTPLEVDEEIRRVIPQYANINFEELRRKPGSSQHWEAKPKPKLPGRIEPPSPEWTRAPGYPMILLSHRSHRHFNTAVMTKRSRHLDTRTAENTLEVNPRDAEEHGIHEHCYVEVATPAGRYRGRAIVTDRVPPGVLAAPWHFGLNEVYPATLDPVSKTPQLKVVPARIVRVECFQPPLP